MFRESCLNTEYPINIRGIALTGNLQWDCSYTVRTRKFWNKKSTFRLKFLRIINKHQTQQLYNNTNLAHIALNLV